MIIDGYNTEELTGLCQLNHENMERFSKCLARAFEGYPILGSTNGQPLEAERMESFWKVVIKTHRDQALCIASDSEINSVMIITTPESKDTPTRSYLWNGGLIVGMKIGVKNLHNILKIVKCMDEIKKRYVKGDCWYILAFATQPETQGKSVGSNLIKRFIAFLDANNQDCYLETLMEKNVRIYDHLGFDLLNVTEVPEMDVTVYSMKRLAGTPFR